MNKQDMTLSKIRSSYDKLEKEMNKPPSDYEAIKQLVEEKNNSITNIEQKYIKRSKKNVEIQSHKKNKRIKINQRLIFIFMKKYVIYFHQNKIYLLLYNNGQYSWRSERYND